MKRLLANSASGRRDRGVPHACAAQRLSRHDSKQSRTERAAIRHRNSAAISELEEGHAQLSASAACPLRL